MNKNTHTSTTVTILLKLASLTGNDGALFGADDPMSGASWFCNGGGRLLSICCWMCTGTDLKICCCSGSGMPRNTGRGGTLHCGGGGVGCGGCNNAAPLDDATTGIVLGLGLLASVLGTFVFVACWDVFASKLAIAGGNCVDACVVLATLAVV